METQIYNLICQKCGKEYSLELTESQFLKGKYRHFCSRSCANTRKHSDNFLGLFRDMVQLVACVLWEHEVVSSSLAIPT